jgi:C-terminal processing protease CtpA/Prc
MMMVTDTEQQQVFREFWDLYDRYYPLFHRKNINWQTVFDTYNAQITTTTTDAELFMMFQTIMNDVLKDGHTSLTMNQNQEAGFQPQENQDINNMIQNNTPNKVTIEASSANNRYISYGTLTANTNIGYINSKVFEPQNDTDAEFNNFKAQVDAALTALQNKQGIILDVRTNGGGQGRYAYYLAGRFISTSGSIEVSRVRVKTSTGSTEASLGEWITSDFEGLADSRVEGGRIGGASIENNTIMRSGTFQYINKVAVLTSRGTGSAAEYFTVAMNTQSHVQTIGDKTFGIFAGSDIVNLTNGSGKWQTRLSVQDVEFKINGTFASYEGIGITPDQEIIPTMAQVTAGDDVHIDAAIQYITN